MAAAPPFCVPAALLPVVKLPKVPLFAEPIRLLGETASEQAASVG